MSKNLPINKSDLFGQAVYDTYLGSREVFSFKLRGEVYPYNIEKYLRDENHLNNSELSQIDMAYGNILDVGCGTGNYLPKLDQKGNVIGIDISEKILEVAKLMGRKNCILADIFEYQPKIKFDTITMFGNNLGMAGSIEKTRVLLERMGSILKDDGQILLILSRRSGDLDYIINDLTPVYKGITGTTFAWVSYNKDYLKRLCQECGWNMHVLNANKHYYSAKLTKNLNKQ